MPYKDLGGDLNYPESRAAWQIRVSLHPSALLEKSANFEKLKEILNKVLKEYWAHINVKVGVFPNEEALYDGEYDGTLSVNGKDRDQRGKEVCIYIPDTEHSFTAEEYKTLLLTLWSELQKAGLPLMYMNIPGDRKILGPCGLITPFSFTSDIQGGDWRGRHGILFKKFEGWDKKHPILRVTLSEKDLAEKKINFDGAEISKTYCSYYEEHREIAVQRLNEDIKNLIGQQDFFEAILFDNKLAEKIKSKIKEYEAEIQKIEIDERGAFQEQFSEDLKKAPDFQLFFKLIDYYPHEPDADFSEHSAIAQLKNLKQLPEASVDSLIEDLRAEYEKKLDGIKLDFDALMTDNNSYGMSLDWSKYIQDYSDGMCKVLIRIKPKEVQAIFRRIILLERGKLAYEQFEREYLKYNERKDNVAKALDEGSSSNAAPMRSYITGLPSIEEARDNYDLVTADHLPIVSTIPCSKTNLGFKNIVVLSWNVLEFDRGNGFAPNGERNYWADKVNAKTCTEEFRDHAENERRLRIVETLAKAVEEHKPHFIPLQEISDNNRLYNQHETTLIELIKQRLPNYAYVTGVGNCVTLYLKDQFVPVESTEEVNEYRNDGGNVTKFNVIKSSNCQIRISNFHHAFSRDISFQRDAIVNFLTGQDRFIPAVESDKETLSIGVGDFNGTIVPLAKGLYNAADSVAPSMFNVDVEQQRARDACDEGIPAQAAWHNKGCFSSTRKPNQLNDGISYQQNISRPINPFTGKVLSDKELKPLSSEELNTFQREEIEELRIGICFEHEPIIKIGDRMLSIFEYDEELKKVFTIEEIQEVHRAVNLNNQKGIGIAMDQQMQKRFVDLGNPNFKFETINRKNESTLYVVYASDDNIPQLTTEMQLFIFAKAIQSLEQLNRHENQAVLKELNLVLNAIRDKSGKYESPYPAVVRHLTGLTLRLTEDPPMTVTELEQFISEFNRELYGKSPSIKVIFGGLIGALIGLVFGTIIGVALTWWGGGLGAIPGMFIGMTKGFSAGTAIVLGHITFGAVVGMLLGFWKVKKYDDMCEMQDLKLCDLSKQNQELLKQDLTSEPNPVKKIHSLFFKLCTPKEDDPKQTDSVRYDTDPNDQYERYLN